jgi:hypothetical protein
MARLPKCCPWWLAAALAVLVLAVGWILVAPQPPVNRVRNGMTYEVVEALLGPPDQVDARWSDGLPVYEWKFQGGSHVSVSMDREGRVRSKDFHPGRVAEWRRQLRALGLPF